MFFCGRPPHSPPYPLQIELSRVRNGKKRDKVDLSVMSCLEDLSLITSSHFCLLEYAEEFPPFLSNGGMGSVILNVYRKNDEKDAHIPKLKVFASCS